MWVAAVLLSLLIGVSLGMLGGGGSILTVPILVYALGVDDKSAIASSLIVVGVTSAVAALQHAKAKNVVWRVALTFAGAGAAGAFAGGRLSALIPGRALLVLFAVLMLAAAAAMWRGRRAVASPAAPRPARILLVGAAVGLVTGLLGAGGGFVIVPALTLFAGLTMPQAVGTSLVVIALNSFAGFLGHAGAPVDLTLTAVVTAAAVAGSFLGAPLARRVPTHILRRAFAVAIALVAAFVLMR